MRKSACIYFFYHLFFRQKGKRNRPTFLRNGEDMSNFAKMVSCTTPVASRPKLSNGKLEKSRVARRSTWRERNRLARFALEDDSEGDFSSVSFNKGGEKDADAEAEEERNNVLLNDPEGKKEDDAGANKEQKNKGVARRRVNPATAAAVAKAKNATNATNTKPVSKDEENKEDKDNEENDEEDEKHTILVRQPFEASGLELELNDADAKASTSGGSVKVKTEGKAEKKGSKTSKIFTRSRTNSNRTKKEREEEDEYAVSNWEKWNERFDQLAKEDEALVALNGQLAEAIDVRLPEPKPVEHPVPPYTGLG